MREINIYCWRKYQIAHRKDSSAVSIADGFVIGKNSNRVPDALAIDERTGTDFWRKAIDKEMSKVKVAWRQIA